VVEDHLHPGVVRMCSSGGGFVNHSYSICREGVITHVNHIYLHLVGKRSVDSGNTRELPANQLLGKTMSQRMPDQSSAVGQAEHSRNETKKFGLLRGKKEGISCNAQS
jgi:hypothetical protein